MRVARALAFMGILVCCRGGATAWGEERLFVYNWSSPMSLASTSPEKRVTAKDWVAIRVDNFNFLNYNIRFSVEEAVLESYQQVDRLWTSLFGAVPEGGTDGVLEKLMVFLSTMKAIEDHMSTVRGELRDTSISSDQKERIVNPAGVKLNELLVQVEQERRSADDVVTSEDNAQWAALFLELGDVYDTVRNEAAVFLEAVKLINDGYMKMLGVKEPGTRVTVTMVAVNFQDTEVGPARVVEYFVHGNRLVVAHAGYLLSDFGNVKPGTFGAEETDLFDLQASEEQTESIALFASVPMVAWGEDERFGVLGTIGAGVRDPGQTVLLGVSIRWDRVFFSYGRLVGSVEKARMNGDAVGSDVGDSEDVVANGIVRERDRGQFFAVSFALLEF